MTPTWTGTVTGDDGSTADITFGLTGQTATLTWTVDPGPPVDPPPVDPPPTGPLSLSAPTATVTGQTVALTATAAADSPVTVRHLQIATRATGAKTGTDCAFTNDTTWTGTRTLTGTLTLAPGTYRAFAAYTLDGTTWVDGPATTFTIPATTPVPPPTTPGTWLSGASGNDAASGAFGTWRGSPVQVAGTWADQQWSDMENLPELAAGTYRAWTKPLDVAIGAFPKGGTWAAAARGDYDGHWTTCLRRLAALRAGRATTYVRFAHEWSGTWYPWSVGPADIGAFRAAWHRLRLLRDQHAPTAQLVCCWNGDAQHNYGPGPIGGMSNALPDPADYDIAAADIYEWHWNTNRQVITQHTAIAAAAGKPFALPEWGCRPDPGDKVAADYVRAVNAAGAAGLLLYDVYFDIGVYRIRSFPQGANAYAGLLWGG